jgi:hypothetical protein
VQHSLLAVEIQEGGLRAQEARSTQTQCQRQ